MSVAAETFEQRPETYEGPRRRLGLTEQIEALRLGVPIGLARAHVARATRLTTDQVVNIRKRKRKRLDAVDKANIDNFFLKAAAGFIRQLSQEMALASEDGGGLDARRLALAEASQGEIAALIAEERARRRGPAPAEDAGGTGRPPC